MLFWQIAKKDLLISIRNRSSWMILILMPIVLILILSAVFGKGDEVSFFPAKIVVVNLDKGASGPFNLNLSEQFMQFLQSKEMQKVVTVTTVSSEEEARKAVRAGTVKAGIVIPANFTTAFFSSENSNLHVLGDAAATIIPGIIKSITDSFLTVMEANRIQMTTTATVVGELQLSPAIQMQVMSELMQKPTIRELPITFKEKVEKGRKSLSNSGYYSAAMAVMFLLFAGNLGVFLILEEWENRTMMRLKTSAITKGALVFGKFLMVMILGVAQLAILILFTMLITKVSWGNSFTGLAFLSVAGVAAIAALCIFVAAITKTSNSANAVNWIAIQILSFLGGSYVPVTIMPPFVRFISRLTPNGQALNGYMTLMQGGSFHDVLGTGLILFGFAAVFLIIGSYFMQFGEEGM